MAATSEFAPAKINLTLHVTGRRADGYHLLDSLVVFAGVGDLVHVTEGAGAFHVTGPMAAAVPWGADNLVLRAAAMMGAVGFDITLEKLLPVASGIGGGSSDAAAVLRALVRETGTLLPKLEDLLRLGADVPVCLAPGPCRMGDIGGDITPLPPLPEVWFVLANPGVSVPTGGVFFALNGQFGAPMPKEFPAFQTAQDLAAFLGDMRNDLQPAAMSLAPVIRDVTSALSAQPGCLLARMSGSGATCFGLFADQTKAERAAHALQSSQPNWWVRAAGLWPGSS